MIKKMIFAGCSYTWGQSLHYYGGFPDDEHPKDGFYYGNKILPHHYQYNVDNRFPTLVADRFSRKPLVEATNGGSNDQMIEWATRKIKQSKGSVDCVIVQTTSFARGYDHGYDEEQQINMILDFIDFCENQNILIQFIHFDWEHHLIPDKVKERTILYDGKLSFYHICDVKHGEMPLDDRTVSSYTYPNYGIYDSHFSKSGHVYMADIITNKLLELGYGEEKPLREPKLVRNRTLTEHNFFKAIGYYNNNDKSNELKQILLYSKDGSDGVPFDLDYSNLNLIEDKILKFLDSYKLLRIWMMVYPPKTGVGNHADDSNSFYRYVFESQSADNSYFEYIKGNKFFTINNFDNHILYIGDLIHRFINDSDTQTRISIVFDTEHPIEYLQK